MTPSLSVRALGSFLILVASACGSDAAVRSTDTEPTDVAVSTSPEQSAPDSTPTITTGPSETIADTVPGAAAEPAELIRVVSTITDIQYYGVCEETFVLDGETWQRLASDQRQAFDPTAYEVAESLTEPQGLRRDQPDPPDVGDDVGTLFVYEDGLGLFRSDSGKIERWMTTEKQEYRSVC